MIFKKRKKLSKIVEDDEPLARYIFYNSYFSKEKKRVKRQTFMPYKNKVSVFRHKNCPEDCILKIGKKIEKNRDNSLKAICSILTRDVRSVNGLNVESDTSMGQHRRHANIINFNDYTDAKIRQIADDLAIIVSKNKSLKIL